MQQESTYASVAAPKANHGRPPPSLPLSSPDWRQTWIRWDDICQCAAGILQGLPHDTPLLRPRLPTLSHQICRWGSRRPWASGSPERAERRSSPGSRAGKWITARKDGDFIATSLHACSWKPKWALMGGNDNLVGPAAASDAECWQVAVAFMCVSCVCLLPRATARVSHLVRAAVCFQPRCSQTTRPPANTIKVRVAWVIHPPTATATDRLLHVNYWASVESSLDATLHRSSALWAGWTTAHC